MDNSNDCVMILPEIAKKVSVKNLAFIIFLALPWGLGLPGHVFSQSHFYAGKTINGIEKKLVDFHVVNEVPKGRRHPHPVFAQLPDIERFTKSERDRKLLAMQRAFVSAGTPFILPPGTPDPAGSDAESFL
jgi:hypothetical protein